MPRIRTIKPEFWDDERVGGLSVAARLLFIATWTLADDEGLLRWTGVYLKAAVFMYDNDVTVEHVEAFMHELLHAKLIFGYAGGPGGLRQDLAYVINFRKHQRINRPQPGKLPPPSIQNRQVKEMYAERDHWRCALCGEHIDPDAIMKKHAKYQHSLDHRTPVSQGGSDYPSNIASTHLHCNKSRGNKPLADFESRNDSLNEAVSVSLNDSLSHSTRDWKGLEGKGLRKDPERAREANSVAGSLARVAKRLARRTNANGTKTHDQLAADVRQLSAAGNQAGDIVKLMAQYHVTLDQVTAWLAEAAPA